MKINVLLLFLALSISQIFGQIRYVVNSDSLKSPKNRVIYADTDSVPKYPRLRPVVNDSSHIKITKEYVKVDSVRYKQHTDSALSLRQYINKGTDAVVGSIFGESRQLSNADSIINRFDALPSFGIYKDNYFVVGTDLFKTPTKTNSDAKFQVSIRNRLTNSTLPFKTYLFLTYTQKAFWDIFQESFPFRDLNFNPSVGLGRAVVRQNRFLGTVTMQFEHESNGKDGDDSRSWNKITFGSVLLMNDRWSVQSQVWIPLVDGENNSDIVSYKGWGFIAADYSSPKRKYGFGCVVTKRAGSFFDANITINGSIRIFSDDNQYLFFEYYNGYGESMLDYRQYRQRFRVGFVIKPNFLSIY